MRIHPDLVAVTAALGVHAIIAVGLVHLSKPMALPLAAAAAAIPAAAPSAAADSPASRSAATAPVTAQPRKLSARPRRSTPPRAPVSRKARPPRLPVFDVEMPSTTTAPAAPSLPLFDLPPQ
ncbi:MAG TPA: hypothetical protein VFF06_25680 [Polyangia bacterium]|nr:hypothetical protein [Polyangia bacterium]